jgi:hypothetical protein
MKQIKGTNTPPTERSDVEYLWNVGLPNHREVHGNGVPVVIKRGWESQPHGEGEQVARLDKRRGGTCDTER